MLVYLFAIISDADSSVQYFICIAKDASLINYMLRFEFVMPSWYS